MIYRALFSVCPFFFRKLIFCCKELYKAMINFNIVAWILLSWKNFEDKELQCITMGRCRVAVGLANPLMFNGFQYWWLRHSYWIHWNIRGVIVALFPRLQNCGGWAKPTATALLYDNKALESKSRRRSRRSYEFLSIWSAKTWRKYFQQLFLWL